MKTILFVILAVIPFMIQASIQSEDDPAREFINSLSKEQKQNTLHPLRDPLRTEWHYLPAASWLREGIQIHELNGSQRELLFKLLESYLSKSGYSKTRKIIELETVLAEMGGDPEYRDPEKYAVAFYGDPALDHLWAWSFEGHHISLNFTVSHDKVTVTPRFMGANPATIPEGPRKGERTLPLEEDLGFELVNSLSDRQKEVAVFRESAFRNIVTSNDQKVDPLDRVGIAFKELVPHQQAILLDLIYEYLTSMPEELAKARLENLKSGEPDEIRFGWAGSLVPGKPHYYRVQGKSFLIELDNTQNNANHIHSVWRDFDGDFGRDLIKEHYLHSHH